MELSSALTDWKIRPASDMTGLWHEGVEGGEFADAGASFPAGTFTKWRGTICIKPENRAFGAMKIQLPLRAHPGFTVFAAAGRRHAAHGSPG